MKTLIPIIFIFLFACKPSVDKTSFYYVKNNDRKSLTDTFDVSKMQPIDPKDKILHRHMFSYKGKRHRILVYTSDNHAPIDAGRLYYTLDNIGIFYMHTTTWFTSIRLQSSNDSINDLISQSLGEIVLTPELHSYGWRLKKIVCDPEN